MKRLKRLFLLAFSPFFIITLIVLFNLLPLIILVSMDKINAPIGNSGSQL